MYAYITQEELRSAIQGASSKNPTPAAQRSDLEALARRLASKQQSVASAYVYYQRATKTPGPKLSVAEDFANAARSYFHAERLRAEGSGSTVLDCAAHGILCALRSMEGYANAGCVGTAVSVGVHAGDSLLRLGCLETACEMYTKALEYHALSGTSTGKGAPIPKVALIRHCHKVCAFLRVKLAEYPEALPHLLEGCDTVGFLLVHCVLKSSPTTLRTALTEVPEEWASRLLPLVEAVEVRDAGAISWCCEKLRDSMMDSEVRLLLLRRIVDAHFLIMGTLDSPGER